jgi:long-chain fatty acid transport protein
MHSTVPVVHKAFLFLILLGGVARAGGFEWTEQSPRGTATVGAQTAVADQADGVYYNPAGLTQLSGLSVLAGANLVVTTIKLDSPTTSTAGDGLFGAPALYAAYRFNSRFAVGLGAFSEFVENVRYDLFLHTDVDLRTTTINPAVAIRPHPRVSIGFGLDILPASLDLQLGAADAHTSGTGFGGNVGVLVVAVPRYLRIGVSYRSAVDVDLSGTGVLTGGLIEAVKTTLPLPHRFGFGLASTPVEKLTLSFDAHLALWDGLSSLALTYTDAMGMDQKLALDLSQRDGYGFRLGATVRPLEHLWLAAGVGYDRTPVRRGWLQLVTPDDDRVVVGVGVGGEWRWLTLGAGYSAQVLTSRTSTYPLDPGAPWTFSGVHHVVTLALGVRISNPPPKGRADGAAGGLERVPEQAPRSGAQLGSSQGSKSKEAASAER